LQALFITAKVLPIASTTAAASTINKGFIARFHRGIPDYPAPEVIRAQMNCR
jgi:hypothetical protein